MEKTPVVVGFQGENSDVPATLLPPNVSPYGLNCDYRDSKLQKRPGFRFLGTDYAEYAATDAAFCRLAVRDDYFVWPDATNTYITQASMASSAAIRTITGSSGYWDKTYIDGKDIVTGHSLGNFRISGSNAYDMCPAAFDETGVLASGSGAGAFNGTYLYKFAWRSSTDGTESPLSDAVTCVATNDAQLDVSVLPTTAPTNSGTNRIRIYRTITGGAIYYYLADHTVGTSTYTDTTTDANLQLNARMDEYRGAAPSNAYGCFVWQDRLWAIYSDAMLYTEKTAGDSTIDSMAVWSRFYGENFVACAPSDEGVIYRGVVVSPYQVFLFGSSGVSVLTGSGPESYSVNKVNYPLSGIYPTSIAQSYSGVYFANKNSIYFMGNDGQIRDVMEGKFRRNYIADYVGGTPCGAWFPSLDAYVLAVDTGAALSYSCFNRVSYVYYENAGVWAKWDIGFDAWCGDVGADIEVYGVVRGRRVLFAGDSWPGRTTYYGEQDSPYQNPVTSQTTGIVSASAAGTFSLTSGSFTDLVLYCPVSFVATDGTVTSGIVTGRNSSSELKVETRSRAALTAPVGGTFYIGAVDWRYRTPKFVAGGDRSAYSRLKRLWVWASDDTENTDDVSVLQYADGTLVHTHALDINNSISSPELTMADARAREHWVEFRQVVSRQKIQLDGYQFGFLGAKVVADGN